MKRSFSGFLMAAIAATVLTPRSSAEFVGWFFEIDSGVGWGFVEVYAQFDSPNDVVRRVFNARIRGQPELPFEQHADFGSGWQRPRSALVIPDSFVCIGEDEGPLVTSTVRLDPPFWPEHAVPIDASWAPCSDQPNQGRADAATWRVLLGRFRLPLGADQGSVSLLWAANIAYDQGAGTPERFGWDDGQGSGPTFLVGLPFCWEGPETDVDGDGVLDCMDNCVVWNPDQQDCDGDGVGDACSTPYQTSSSVPTFRLQPESAGGGSVSHMMPVPTGISIDGLSFSGTVSGLAGTDGVASDLELRIAHPCEPGEEVVIGGSGESGSIPWDFQGQSPGIDGTYVQAVIPVGLGSTQWYCDSFVFRFRHGSDDPSAPEMTWSDVVITLHRMGQSHPAADCNGNGVGDLCDLAEPGADVDGNGVLDECEDPFVIDVPDEAATIQAAIDMAQDGWIVRVAPGTYQEQITLGSRRIELESTGGPEVTVIDGSALEGSVVSIVQNQSGSCGGLALRGFTIRGGTRGSLIGSSSTLFGGGGIYAANAHATIERCVVEQNQADYGGGLYLWRSEIALYDCVVRSNAAVFDGGGCQFFRGENLAIRCKFDDNVAGASGGGLHSVLGRPTLIDVEMRWNEAAVGGGASLFIDGESQVWVVGSLLQANTAGMTGGGIWIRSGFDSVFLENTVVCGNEPSQVSGAFTDLGGNDLCPCEGDLDGDGVVGGSDIASMLASWGDCSGNACAVADLDGNGLVSGGDLAILLAAWGVCR